MRSDATNDTPHGGVTAQLSDSEPHCDSDARESDAMNNPPIHTSAPAIESAVRDGGVHHARETTPAEGSPRATAPMSERAQIHNDWSRRVKHTLIGAMIAGLTWYGQRTGHPVEWYVVAVLGALGVGPEAVKNALTARPKAAVAGVASLVALAVAGDALNVSQLGALSSLGVAALPFVDRAATAVNLTE